MSNSMTFDLFARNRGTAGFNSFSASGKQALDGLLRKAAELAVAYVGLNSVMQFGKDSVTAAQAQELAQAKLTTAVKNSGFQYTKYAPQVDAAEASGRKLGFTNDDIVTGLATLTTGLKDPSKALQVLHVAEDLAAAKGMSVSAAALLVTKGMEGQLKPLKTLGIDIPVYAGGSQQVAVAQGAVAKAQAKVNAILAATPNAVDASSKAHTKYQKAVTDLTTAQTLLSAKESSGQQILDALSERLKGSAADAADTAAGKMKAFKSEVNDAEEKIGTALMPTLETLVGYGNQYLIPALDGFSGWFAQTGGPAISGFLGWVNKIPGGFGKALVSFGLLTGAAYALDVALDANPVGAILAGLVGLAAVAGIVATNWDTIGPVVIGAVNSIDDAAMGIVEDILDVFSALANGLIYGFLAPYNNIREALGLKPITIHLDDAAGLKAIQSHMDAGASLAEQSAAGGAKAGSGGSIPARAMAAGGTIQPRPGGTLIRAAEAGRSETIVDTATLQAAMRARSGVSAGDTYVIKVKGTLVHENQLIRTLQKQKNNAQRRGQIAKGAF